MRWPWTPRPALTPTPPRSFVMAHPIPSLGDDDGTDAALAFCCSSCGRTDLPPTGDWDPPICLECDAQLNDDMDTLGNPWDS